MLGWRVERQATLSKEERPPQVTMDADNGPEVGRGIIASIIGKSTPPKGASQEKGKRPNKEKRRIYRPRRRSN